MIIIEVKVFFNVMDRVKIHCTCTPVFVSTLYNKEFFTEIFIPNSLAVVWLLGANGDVRFII